MKREELIESIFATMQQMHRTASGKFQSLMGACAISMSQMELLMTVKRLQPVSAKDIAAQMRLTPGAITQLLDGLVEQGLVERTPSAQDRRVVQVTISATGKQRLQDIWNRRRQMLLEVMQTMDTEELTVMLSVQQKILAHLEAHADTPKTQKGKE